ncbi:NitT/TauT family transport system permease protein [Bradyrhizobium ottawaense]
MSRPTMFALQVLVAVVCIVLWQVLSTVPVFGKILLPPFFFSNPLDVFSQIVKWFASGVIWKHLGITLAESILAFVIGSAGGVLVGFWFARQPLVAAVFDPYVKMVNALPRVVLAPIFALWLGLGIWSKVALGVTLVFFIVFFNVYQGVKEVSRTVLDNGRMLGMSERQLMRHVYWPSALSWMFSSLHTSVGFAVVGAVVGEYLGSAAGLGYLIQQGRGRVRRRRRIRRHVRAVGLRHPDRLWGHAGGAAPVGVAADRIGWARLGARRDPRIGAGPRSRSLNPAAWCRRAPGAAS